MSHLALDPLLLAAVVGTVALLLVAARQHFGEPEDDVVLRINECLPQTQCAQCGHPGCLPYAKAIASGEPINRCPPGGKQTISALAQLLGREETPLDDAFGQELPRRVAVIREAECIGCTLCIQACPVDAIVGAQQLMHSILEDACTGCDLCLPPCPVDCIDMVETTAPQAELIKKTSRKTLKPLLEQAESECIRCGDCEVVCPKRLQPQYLFWRRNSNEAMIDLDLDACIECRLCDRVCPSAIPLTQYFQTAKLSLRSAEENQKEAELAKNRFERRESRLANQIIKTTSTNNDRKALLDKLSQKGQSK